MNQTSIDPEEVAKFEAMAAEWWDPQGASRPLHMLNPCRLDYVTQQVAVQFARDMRGPRPFEGLRLVDIGCGGGLMAEPMARLGADVVGVDAAEGNIPVAQTHARAGGLEIDYRATTAEDLAAEGARFDVVLALEIVEHVADPAAFLATCRALLAPGGLLIASTLNRTPQSYAVGVLGAERVMRWLPVGTHDWSRFITPDEMYGAMEAAGLRPLDRKGMVFRPLRWDFQLSESDLSVNYIAAAERAQE